MFKPTYHNQLQKCLKAHYHNSKRTPQQRLQLLINLLISQCRCFFVIDLKLKESLFNDWLQNNNGALNTIKSLCKKNRIKYLNLLRNKINHYNLLLENDLVSEYSANKLLLSLQTLRAEEIKRSANGSSLLVKRLRIVDEAYKRVITQVKLTNDRKYIRKYTTNIKQSKSYIQTESSHQFLINQWKPKTEQQNNKIIFLLPGRNLAGHSYRSMCSSLAQLGYLVISPNFNGIDNNNLNSSSIDDMTCDLKFIYQHIKANNPNMEIIPMGHSLGAAILLNSHEIFCKNDLSKMILLNPAFNEFGSIENQNLFSLFRWLFSSISTKRCFFKNALPETKIIREYTKPTYQGMRKTIQSANNVNMILTHGYNTFCNLLASNNINILVVHSKYDKIVNNIKIQSSNTQYKMIYGDHLQVMRDGEYFAHLTQSFIEAA